MEQSFGSVTLLVACQGRVRTLAFIYTLVLYCSKNWFVQLGEEKHLRIPCFFACMHGFFDICVAAPVAIFVFCLWVARPLLHSSPTRKLQGQPAKKKYHLRRWIRSGYAFCRCRCCCKLSNRWCWRLAPGLWNWRVAMVAMEVVMG